MKKNITFLFLFLNIAIVFSQKFLVLDSESRKEIPYAAIYLPKSNSGFYATNNGRFFLEKIKNNDSIFISSLGFYTLKTVVQSLNDSIFLKPLISKLDEVVILTKQKSFKKIGFRKKDKTGWFGTQGLQLGILIKVEEKYLGSYISKVIIPFKKRMHGEMEYNYKSIFKLSVFSVKENNPHLSLLETPIIIKFDQLSKDFVEVDISKEFIKLNKNGVFICIEQVGELDKKNIVINKNKFLPGLGFSSKKPKGFESFSSYSKDKNSEYWKELGSRLKLASKLYLAVQLIVAEYK